MPTIQRAALLSSPSPAKIALWLGISDERDAWMRRLLQAERAAYIAGYDAGFTDAAEELWARRRCEPPGAVYGPSLAKLNWRRWGPGGRERFGEAREGDYPGTGA